MASKPSSYFDAAARTPSSRSSLLFFLRHHRYVVFVALVADAVECRQRAGADRPFGAPRALCEPRRLLVRLEQRRVARRELQSPSKMRLRVDSSPQRHESACGAQVALGPVRVELDRRLRVGERLVVLM